MSENAPVTSDRLTKLRTHIRNLEAEIRETTKDIRASKKPNFRGDVNWGHVRQLRAHRHQVKTELYDARNRLIDMEDASQSADPADMTDTEWMEYHAEQANVLDIPALEVYVQTWARKHGAVIVMEQDGHPQLRFRSTG